jgi:sigma-B regulation protein RsbU (phosphoserine phosphatase)
MFITAFLGIIDFSKGKFTYVNAGHNPPLIKKSGKDYAWLQVNSGFVLGGMENIIYKPMECNLEKGDRIFCYTDGVTEAMNEKDELYSDERLMETLNAKKDIENLDELITEIKTDVDVFAGEADQADDITMLVVEMKQKASG